VNQHVDIAVVGGGAAGLAAAISAARCGHTTALIDRRNSAGGTGGFSGRCFGGTGNCSVTDRFG